MNIANSFSSMKTYQFFEEIRDKPEQNQSNKNLTNENNNKSYSLTLNDISPSGINQMQSLDDIIFICGKAIYKINSQIIRESLILKIINNKIYDEYRIFNGLYYDFKIKFFKNKYYFIILGGDLIRYIKDKKEEMLMVTTLKIYDAYKFIEPKYDKYIEENIEGEPYPKSLIKKLQILKKINENEFIIGINSEDKSQYSNYESFQNVISFTIDSNFTSIAISSIKGDIILINGYPDLIQRDKNKIRMEFLPKIIKNREIFISNIEFSSFLNKKNINKKILYASTANNIYYYEWKSESLNNKNSNKENNNIKIKTLIEEGKGAYNSCLNSKDNLLLIALTNDSYILEYKNLNLENSWYFEGNKIFVSYFKEYILLITSNNKYTTIQIYDKNNNFLLYNNTSQRRIISVCYNEEFIYIFFEEMQNMKYIAKIKEKENKIKFEIFYSKHEYDLARDYAVKIKFPESKLAEISRRYAEYEYSKGDFKIAIEQYIKTINYVEPNIVIEKFLEKAKLDYLIIYLEAIQNNEKFQKRLKADNNKKRNKINNKYLAGLLFNCYIVQGKFEQFKNFIKSRNKKKNYDVLKMAIDTLIESNNLDLAIDFAKNKDMTEEIIYILIFKQKKLTEALDILLPITKAQKANIANNDIIKEELMVKEKLNLILKYGQYFLMDNEGEIPDLFFNRVSSFIEMKKMYLDQKEIVKIIQIFIISDKYFKLFFDKINSYDIDYDEKIIQRRIELYLEEKEENYKLNIIKMLKDKKYKNKYNKDNLMLLFKYNNFKEGINTLKEISNKKQDLMQLYMDNKNYDKLIEIIDDIIYNNEKILEKSGDKFNQDISFIIIILKFIIEEKKINNNKNLDIYIKNILNKVSNSSELFFSHEFIKILYEINNEFSINDINFYINNIIGKEVVSISTYLYHINETKKALEKIEDEIIHLKKTGIKFKLNKCDECNMTINFPCVFYYCGHCFHKSCINIMPSIKDKNKEMNNDKINCPKCKKAKIMK